MENILKRKNKKYNTPRETKNPEIFQKFQIDYGIATMFQQQNMLWLISITVYQQIVYIFEQRWIKKSINGLFQFLDVF